MKNNTILDMVINLLPANIYWRDREGYFLGCNLRQAKTDGYSSPNDLIGKTLFQICKDQELAQRIHLIDQKIMENNEPYLEEELAIDSENNPAYYLSHKVPVHDKSGNVVGILGISIDITERKKMEEETLAAKAKAKSEESLREVVMILAGSIVHDLRSPLATIDGYADVLNEELPKLLEVYNQASESQREKYDIGCFRLDRLGTVGHKIQESAKVANESIDTTLKTLSKSLLGELTESDLIPCSIQYCINQTLDRYPFGKDERELIHHDRYNDFTFLGNSLLINRVLINLIKNSLHQIKENQRGEIFISASSDNNGNYLKVKDTAGGAPPEIIDTLFSGYKTTKAEGTGVGLAFCKYTMHSFGGDIACTSVDGDYIEFILTFPIFEISSDKEI